MGAAARRKASKMRRNCWRGAHYFTDNSLLMV